MWAVAGMLAVAGMWAVVGTWASGMVAGVRCPRRARVRGGRIPVWQSAPLTLC